MTTNIMGIVKVNLPATNELVAVTTEGCEYLCKLVLRYAPIIQGAEHDAEVQLVCPKDAFFINSNPNPDTESEEDLNWSEYNELYIVLHGRLRSRDVQEVHDDVMAWIRHVSKLLYVGDLCIHLYQYSADDSDAEIISYQPWMSKNYDYTALPTLLRSKHLSKSGNMLMI